MGGYQISDHSNNSGNIKHTLYKLSREDLYQIQKPDRFDSDHIHFVAIYPEKTL